ncbi:MAG TPA: hypothetical protein VJB99_00500 [Patescibacteria group bacterium]|nr:hypothetical protein [Patescibacteria group bacterium]
MEPKTNERRKTGTRKPAVKRTAAVPKVVPLPPSTLSLRVYRRIAGAFALLVGAVLVFVIFLSVSRVTVRIVPQPQTVSASFLAEVSPTASVSGAAVRGSVIQKTFEQAKEFVVTAGEKKEVEGKAGGTVTIFNETSRSQPLVATTRLLTPEGILFRLDEGVTVPARGSVQAIVHADQAGKQGDVEPTRFTIPGLSSSLQSVIYATSDTSLSGGVQTLAILSQGELDQAASSLALEMLEAAKGELQGNGRPLAGQLFESETLERASNVVPGTETDRFTVSLTLRVTAFFYHPEDVKRLAEAKLYEALSDGFTFVSVPLEDVKLTVQRPETEETPAQVRLSLTAVSTLAPTHPLLDQRTLAGLPFEEARKRLMDSGTVKDVQFDAFPPWLQRLPAGRDRMEIVIEEPVSVSEEGGLGEKKEK